MTFFLFKCLQVGGWNHSDHDTSDAVKATFFGALILIRSKNLIVLSVIFRFCDLEYEEIVAS